MGGALVITQLIVRAKVKHKQETSERVNMNNVEWEYPLPRVGVYRNDIRHLKVSSKIEGYMYIYISMVEMCLGHSLYTWMLGVFQTQQDLNTQFKVQQQFWASLLYLDPSVLTI